MRILFNDGTPEDSRDHPHSDKGRETRITNSLNTTREDP